ncbi:type II toxin-antitoxin system RelE/ParE family toxin [Alcanivorax sp. CY1518]|uniref:Type II toxin-antitoxin system RelE/ParE family toxin n=1 Tax=Alcanivorax quisquiliarum TaxID=2933565 RepID=A0ABT0EAK0_9GAMM|nr:type II toxin-antitoxin system RelE/ParE family toxin [Alcanivorax quisquiliarum]
MCGVTLAWTIEYEAKAAKQLRKLDKSTARQIRDYLHGRVAERADPRALGKVLIGDRLGGYWRYRVGDYRLICEIQDDRLVVLVLKVGHRRQIYD